MSSACWRRGLLSTLGSLTLVVFYQVSTAAMVDPSSDDAQTASDQPYAVPYSDPSPPPGTDPSTSAYAKGEFIVKFKPTLTQCAHCLLAQRQPFATAFSDASDSIDRLHQQVQVRSARSVFFEHHHLTTAQAQVANQQRIEQVKSRFPQRTQRTPADAQLPDLTNIYVFEVPEEADIEAICRLYQADSHVEYAHPNYIAEAQFVPNDPYYHSSNSWGQGYDDLWGPKKMQAAQAWDVTQGNGIVAAVVDTGLDYRHPDIAANVWTNPGEIPDNQLDDDGNGYVDDTRGWDFVENDPTPTDGHGHGTHVAGTIAAVGNNGLGVIGVAPQAKIMPVRGLDSEGYGTISGLASGLVYAAQNGADVINNSWACSLACPIVPVGEDAVQTAHGLGTVVVFAAGNDKSDVIRISPQNMTNPKPIVVAATDHLDQTSSFSNYGLLIDVAAPGGESGSSCTDLVVPSILSLRASGTDMYAVRCENGVDQTGKMIVGTQYFRARGTSMAAPHAAGAAALVLAHRPTFTAEDVRQALRLSADDLGVPGFDPQTGAGRINVARAVGVESVPRVKITSPARWASFNPMVADAVTITGSASTGPGFQQYQLFYGEGAQPPMWTPIGEPQAVPVNEGALGTWAIGQLAGLYSLRLLVTTASEGPLQEFVPTVIIAKELPSVRPITTHRFTDALAPASSGHRIVWTDYRNSPTWSLFDPADIYLYDLTTNTEQAITTHLAHQTDPAISGDRIVWQDYRNSWSTADIYLYDLATQTERSIATHPAHQRRPAISGDRVVWEDDRNGNWDIFLYDLRTNTERAITADPAAQYAPAISGNWIVWRDFRNGNWNSDIYLYDLASNTERQITTNSSDQISPSISGDRIVWQDRRNGNWDVYLYDLATGVERPVTTHPADQQGPAISGDRIVWQDLRNGNWKGYYYGFFEKNWDIYVYNLATETEQFVTTHPAMQSDPVVSGPWVVWQDLRDGPNNLYLAELNRPPVLEPIGDQRVTPGQRLTFRVSGSDPDGDALTFRAASLPPGATFDPGTATFSWIPTGSQVGRYPDVRFEVDDGELVDAEDITIAVLDPTVPFLDIDGDRSMGPATDGMLLTRYLFGFRGASLTGGAIGPNCSRCTAAAIEGYLQEKLPVFDIDGDGQPRPLSDGVLVQRYLDGLRVGALIEGAVELGATRTSAEEIERYLTALEEERPLPLLDCDGDGYVRALAEGVVLVRYTVGLRGEALVRQAVEAGCSRCTAEAIEGYLRSRLTVFDVDANGSTNAYTDGLLIVRYLFGFRGEELVADAIGQGAKRTAGHDIERYLAALLVPGPEASGTDQTLVQGRPRNGAEGLSQAVPGSLEAGQRVEVTVTMLNLGTAAWTQAGDYKLGSQNPQDNLTWGLGRVLLAPGETVVPGQPTTFTFTITAPTTPGTYHFQWRMVQELVEWFGDLTPNVEVIVGCSAATPCGTTITAGGVTQWCRNMAGQGYRWVPLPGCMGSCPPNDPTCQEYPLGTTAACASIQTVCVNQRWAPVAGALTCDASTPCDATLVADGVTFYCRNMEGRGSQWVPNQGCMGSCAPTEPYCQDNPVGTTAQCATVQRVCRDRGWLEVLCGDGLCTTRFGETPETCPRDCPVQ